MLKHSIALAFCLLAFSNVSLAQEIDHCLNAETGTWVSSPEGCAHFFWCSEEGYSMAGKCNDGRWFDFDRQVCDWPDMVKCDLDGPVQPPVDIECPSVGKKLFSHPFSCRKFVICLDGRQFDQDCEHGKHFSYIQEQCVSVEDAQCYIDYNLCPIVDDVFNPFIFASPRDCSVFYSCMLRNIIPGRCAPGLHFNPERLACDFPENVECTPTLNPDEFLPEIIQMECEDSDYLIYHKHPQSCEHYFLCVNGESRLRFCAPGLHFNPTSSRCDRPENAGCTVGQDSIAPIKAVPFPVHIQ